MQDKINKPYWKVKPCAALENYVESFWILENTTTIEHFACENVLPYGRIELSFHFRDNIEHPLQYNNSSFFSRSFIAGQFIKPQILKPASNIGIVGVRFLPDGAYPFLKTPISQFTNTTVSLELLWSKQINEIQEKIYYAKSHLQRIEILQNFLISRLDKKYTIDRTMNEAISIIQQTSGQTNIEKLSESVYISSRQLERKFNTIVGISPKTFSRIARLKNAIWLLLTHSNNNNSLTSIAYDCGFTDQSHFIRDFTELAGVTPSAYVLNKQIMPAYSFNEFRQMSNEVLVNKHLSKLNPLHF